MTNNPTDRARDTDWYAGHTTGNLELWYVPSGTEMAVFVAPTKGQPVPSYSERIASFYGPNSQGDARLFQKAHRLLAKNKRLRAACRALVATWKRGDCPYCDTEEGDEHATTCPVGLARAALTETE